MRSIRTQLLVGLLGGMLLVLLAGAALIFFIVRDEVAELFDHQLEHTAYAFAAQPLQAIPVVGDEPDDNPEADLVIQVWGSDGRLLLQSRPQTGLSRQPQRGFFELQLGAERWRLFSLQAAGHLVQVAQPLYVRDAIARQSALDALQLFAVLFPVAALLIYLTVGAGMRALQRMAQDVGRRSHLDLTPIDPRQLPVEVTPLVNSLNDLMARLNRVISSQKTFVADAAHELLTPITALQLQAQLLSRAVDEDRRHETLVALRAGLNRTVHVARQLLALARQDPDLEQPATELVDLTELARHVIQIQSSVAELRGMTLELHAPAPAMVTGISDALAVLLSNLLENALKYTPTGGRVRVNIVADSAQCRVVVEDSGPGVPAEEYQRIFDRFYRRPGTGALGSGLGLAIVKNIADRHQAAIQLQTSASLGGLCIQVMFAKAGG
ncbi:ATP-binding protein [Steroidobacter sp.]|uniref:ATP-binding protein n=1 Tax=Steroidobacter sp. TaxID=1978227 RepID=UPI001A45BEFC|nr:ATP-binding protein [Steroidobacter sp.]MBL8267762.1 sensor histidine kinase N-terminal domain-containing protein [Steroidobacter sp.]